MGQEKEQWHLSKSVPLSIIFFLIVQSVALVVWATRLDSRVGALELADVKHEARIMLLEAARDKLVLIEERQNNVIKILETNSRKIDVLIGTLAEQQKK